MAIVIPPPHSADMHDNLKFKMISETKTKMIL